MSYTPQNSAFILSAAPSFPNVTNLVSIKLDSENYLSWRDQITPFLFCSDLMGYVDGSILEPPKTVSDDSKTSPSPRHIEWLNKDQFVLSCL